MKKLILAAALLLCAAAPATAQEEPSPSEVEAIREMLEVSRTRENFIRGMELGMEAGGLLELTDELRQVLRDFMDEHFRYEDMEPDFIRVYADLFTEEEIRGLTAFYRSPAGARFVELTPELTSQVQQITMQRMTDAMPELMRRIMEAMEDEEQAPGTTTKS